MPTCANTILSQLGGHRFIAMTGAKNFYGDEVSLTMSLPYNTTKKIRWVRIAIDGDDTYTITFFKMIKKVPTMVKQSIMVHVDNLQEVFTQHTGLDTSL